MSLLPRFRSDLWRRIAEAQDVVSEGDRPLSEVGRDIARVIANRGAPRVAGGYRLRLRPAALAISVVAVVGIGAFALRHRTSVRQQQSGTVALSLSPAGPHATDDRAFVADARSDLPLQFSDGSTVIFRAGSAGRMQRLTDSGAEIALERGWLNVHVVHADTTLWLVHAGPYRVRVTGTRFAMTWADPNLELDLFEGAVNVDGSVLGAGVPLRAGHRLKISSGTVLVEPLDKIASPARSVSASTSASAPAPSVVDSDGDGTSPPLISDVALDNDEERMAPPVDGPRLRGLAARFSERRVQDASDARDGQHDHWLVLAERGAYRQALNAANRLGWKDLCRHLDARRLLTLGDVARYTGARSKARQAFAALVTRFPEDRLAADAVFSLGRLAFEGRRPGEAAGWFRRYVADWPDAPLADQAVGRLLECTIRVDDRDGARSAARRYLERAPNGPHAILAREVLAQPVDGPQ